jgi:purine-cytosine permease-like protein
MIFMNSPILLILFTGLIAGLVAGFAALSGSYLRYKKEEESYHKKLA